MQKKNSQNKTTRRGPVQPLSYLLTAQSNLFPGAGPLGMKTVGQICHPKAKAVCTLCEPGMAAGVSLRRRTLGTALNIEGLEGAANLRRRDWLAQNPGWTGQADWP